MGNVLSNKSRVAPEPSAGQEVTAAGHKDTSLSAESAQVDMAFSRHQSVPVVGSGTGCMPRLCGEADGGLQFLLDQAVRLMQATEGVPNAEVKALKELILQEIVKVRLQPAAKGPAKSASHFLVPLVSNGLKICLVVFAPLLFSLPAHLEPKAGQSIKEIKEAVNKACLKVNELHLEVEAYENEIFSKPALTLLKTDPAAVSASVKGLHTKANAAVSSFQSLARVLVNSCRVLSPLLPTGFSAMIEGILSLVKDLGTAGLSMDDFMAKGVKHSSTQRRPSSAVMAQTLLTPEDQFHLASLHLLFWPLYKV